MDHGRDEVEIAIVRDMPNTAMAFVYFRRCDIAVHSTHDRSCCFNFDFFLRSVR